MAMMNEMEYRTIGSALAGGYRAAVYCRLSKDDDLQGESASIANQRDMLEKYCEKQGWEVVAVYQDDGFTGLNMERPDLQRMLRAIERRQINLVITKDLSRLGRNYLQTTTFSTFTSSNIFRCLSVRLRPSKVSSNNLCIFIRLHFCIIFDI